MRLMSTNLNFGSKTPFRPCIELDMGREIEACKVRGSTWDVWARGPAMVGNKNGDTKHHSRGVGGSERDEKRKNPDNSCQIDVKNDQNKTNRPVNTKQMLWRGILIIPRWFDDQIASIRSEVKRLRRDATKEFQPCHDHSTFQATQQALAAASTNNRKYTTRTNSFVKKSGNSNHFAIIAEDFHDSQQSKFISHHRLVSHERLIRFQRDQKQRMKKQANLRIG